MAQGMLDCGMWPCQGQRGSLCVARASAAIDRQVDNAATREVGHGPDGVSWERRVWAQETRGGVWNPALALKQPGWCSKAVWLAALVEVDGARLG